MVGVIEQIVELHALHAGILFFFKLTSNQHCCLHHRRYSHSINSHTGGKTRPCTQTHTHTRIYTRKWTGVQNKPSTAPWDARGVQAVSGSSPDSREQKQRRQKKTRKQEQNQTNKKKLDWSRVTQCTGAVRTLEERL